MSCRCPLLSCSIPLGVLLALSACGGGAEPVDATVATVEPIRGAATIAGEAATPTARVGPGQTVEVGEAGLARVRLDGGPRLLLDAGGRVVIVDADVAEITAGRVFVQVPVDDQLEVRTERGTLRASDTAFSVTVAAGGQVTAYVVRGEVSYVAGEVRGIGSAGEQLVLPASGAPRLEPAQLWSDWTGGLARTGPGDVTGPAGVGTLSARVPDETGQPRWPLVARRLDVRVQLLGDYAITEVDQVFFNPASETVEGIYRFRAPETAVLQRFAVDRNGRLVDGYVRERAQAQQAYEQQVYRGSTDDPALLVWDAPGSYSARIYPIAAGETRRIVIRYAEWLQRRAPGEPRLYRYPMGGGARPPHIQEFSLTADISQAYTTRVRAGMDATVEEQRVMLRQSDFEPRADFWLELFEEAPPAKVRAYRGPHQAPRRAPGSRVITNEADERDYFFLPLVLPTALHSESNSDRGFDLVIVADISAATDRSRLELGRSTVESLTAHLDEDDRVAIVTSDLTIRAVGDEESPALAAASPVRLQALLDGLARVPAGGATDLGAAVAAAAELLDPARSGAVVYVGDGAPTVGELGAEGLLQRMARLPNPVRLYAVGVGASANLDLLSSLTRGGGLALRVEDRSAAAEAALRILAHAGRPLVQRVTVELGPGIDNAFPRGPVDVVLGETLPVVGRVRGDPPTTVTVTGVIAGEEFTREIQVETVTASDATDLRLRWASERLQRLLLENAGREAVAELGTRCGLITPFTSYYVPSARELREGGHSELLRPRPLLLDPARSPASPAPGAVASLVGPALGSFAPAAAVAGLAGCRASDFLQGGESASEPGIVASSPVATANEPAPTSGSTSMESPPPPAVLAPQPAAATPPQEAEQSEGGGGGVRHRGEEGVMGRVARSSSGGRYQNRAAQPALPQARPAPPPEPIEAQAEAAARSSAGPRAAAERRARRTESALRGARADTAAPAKRASRRSGWATSTPDDGQVAPEAEPSTISMNGQGRGGGDFGESGSIGLDGLGTIGHGGGGGSGQGYGRGPSADEANHWRSDASRLALARPRRPIPTGTTGATTITTRTTTTTITTWSQATHRPSRCSDAATQPLSERRSLWQERLGNAGSVSGWARVYHSAIRQCEAPSWRDRRALLNLIVAEAGSVSRLIQVHRAMRGPAVRRHLRSAIFRRVRTPADLRVVRQHFGVSTAVDWELVEQMLARAPNLTARIRLLRQLLGLYPRTSDITVHYPHSFELKLRLLAALEEAGRLPEARRLAHELRSDPLADSGVRTAVGEMFLRQGNEAEARRVFSEIVEFAPYDGAARRRLGDLYRAHGWFEEAYRQYQTLAEIRPDDAAVSLLLAQAAAGVGRIDEAIRLEQRLAETAEPGAAGGLARVAILWSSVRFAKLRKVAHDGSDEERLRALLARMRRSGVLREAGALRVSLTWSHPDAGLSLWVAHPGATSLSRPTDIAPEFGLEAFDLREREASGRYRLEVRRQFSQDLRTPVEAELVIVLNEGQSDERIIIERLRFEGDQTVRAWTLEGENLATAEPTRTPAR